MNKREMELLQFIRDEVIEGLIALKFTTTPDDWSAFDFSAVLDELNLWLKDGKLK